MACADSRAIEESRTALNSFISACKDNPETQPNATAVGRLVRCAASDVGRPGDIGKQSEQLAARVNRGLKWTSSIICKN